MKPVLQVESLTKGFPTTRSGRIKNIFGIAVNAAELKYAVKNLNLEVSEGEILGLLGGNGAGKSTTLKMITGLVLPTYGSVKICGKDIVKERREALKNVGAVIEGPDLFLKMSAINNLDYLAKIQGGVNREYTEEILGLFGADDYANEKVKTYSAGMKQKIAITQALMGKPKLLILDEPTNSLDAESIIVLRKMLKSLAKEGTAIIVSSHNLAEMEQLCTKVAVINKGELVAFKEIGEIKFDGQERVEFICENFEKASKIINEKFNIKAENIDGKTVLNCDGNTVPLIISELVMNGIKVGSLKTKEKSLEDIFTDLTKGNDKNEPKETDSDSAEKGENPFSTNNKTGGKDL